MSLSFVATLPYLLNIFSGKGTLIKFTLGYVLSISSQILYNLRLFELFNNKYKLDLLKKNDRNDHLFLAILESENKM